MLLYFVQTALQLKTLKYIPSWWVFSFCSALLLLFLKVLDMFLISKCAEILQQNKDQDDQKKEQVRT